MLQILHTTLKKSPTNNFLCAINGNIGEKFENKDNEFIYSDNDAIIRRKKIIFDNLKDDPTLLKNWYGCLSYIQTKNGMLISFVDSINNKEFINIFESSMKLLKNWMSVTNNDIAIAKSFYEIFGKKYSKYIKNIIYNTFDDCSQTFYISRSMW